AKTGRQARWHCEHKVGPGKEQRRGLAQAFLKPGHASLEFIEPLFDLRLAVTLAVQLVVNPGSKLRQLVAEHTGVVVNLPGEEINLLLHILAQRLESVFKRIETSFKRIESSFKRIESSFKRLESLSKPEVGLPDLLHMNDHLGKLPADGVKHLLDPHLQAPFSCWWLAVWPWGVPCSPPASRLLPPGDKMHRLAVRLPY